MTAISWLASLAVLLVVAFVVWAWLMDRWDEREERRQRDRMLR